MGKKLRKADYVTVMSILGMTGVLITIISDFILIGKPNSAYAFLKLGTESMWDIPVSRIAAGAFIGMVVLPFQILGLLPVYFALKPAGRILPVMAVIVNAHTLLMGVAFHISYAFIGSGWILYHSSGVESTVSGLVGQFGRYWLALAVIMSLELLFSSIIYTIVVLKGKSLYPRWMAVFNPIGIMIMAIPLIFLLPYPVGGYIAPACLNISTMIFFLLNMIMWRRQINDRP